MDELIVEAGDVVATDFGLYTHLSLVTDRFSDTGKPMLISASGRTGTVLEKDWDVVTEGRKTWITKTKVKSLMSVHEVLARAREQIGEWSYSVTGKNCEHFINWAMGLEVTSAQVKAGAAGAAIGAAAVGIFFEKPTLGKFLGVAFLAGLLGVLAAKPKKRHQKR
uniref:Lecithin retinol acyltransferase n=1 Tax=Candidatus Kentrum sp. LFY TaxID=2126342 RepID=A0A450UGB2_9GAMM|nr:MAG: Lecithin retinol acyltransferase [Candidatus Kentron sp. LFY]